MDARLKSPFTSGARYAIDERFAERLLSKALSKGGDYADLFFEYAISGGFGFEDGILRSSSRSVSRYGAALCRWMQQEQSRH